MLIILSSRAVICQSVAEVWLTSVAHLAAISRRFNVILTYRKVTTNKLSSTQDNININRTETDV